MKPHTGRPGGEHKSRRPQIRIVCCAHEREHAQRVKGGGHGPSGHYNRVRVRTNRSIHALKSGNLAQGVQLMEKGK